MFSRIKLIFLLLCAAPLYAAPTITVTATSTTLLGTGQTITLTCSLIDPNQTGILRTGATVITNFSTSTTTPGTTATCGPLYGNDVITDGFGNASTSYYLIGAYTVSSGIIASTPVLLQAYQFAGSGTFDLSATLPFSLGAVSPAGSVLGQNLTFTGTDTATGPWTFGTLNVTTLNLTGALVVPGTLTATQLISTVSTGTAPLAVSSTTVVPNLNAQLHNGKSAPTGNIVGDTDTQTLTNKTLTSPTINAPAISNPTITSAITLGVVAIASANGPTISSGFGTSPSIVSNNTVAFTITIGSGGTANSGVIAFPSATNGWNVFCEDTTTFSTTVFRTRQTASTTGSATIGNFNTSAASAAWTAGDTLSCIAMSR